MGHARLPELHCISKQKHLMRLVIYEDSLIQASKGVNEEIQQALMILSVSELCEEISNESFTGRKSMCLKWEEKNRYGTAPCLYWSERILTKGHYINELRKRNLSIEQCIKTLFGDTPGCSF